MSQQSEPTDAQLERIYQSVMKEGRPVLEGALEVIEELLNDLESALQKAGADFDSYDPGELLTAKENLETVLGGIN